MIDVTYENVKRGSYMLDENGNLYSTTTNRMMSPGEDKDGYLRVRLVREGGGWVDVRIGNLVLHTFKGGPPKQPEDI